MSIVVAFHGFTGLGRSWNSVFGCLGSSWRCTAPNLPGHGQQFRRLPETFEATVTELAARVKQASDQPVMLAGYSLGARLALGVAVEHPELVKGLLLIGVRPGLPDEQRAKRAAADDERAQYLESEGTAAFIESWQQLSLFASQRRLSDETRRAQHRLRLEHQAEGLAWALRTLSPGRMPDYRSRLGELTMPVSLLVGAEDRKFRDLAQDMAPVLRHGEVHVVEKSGHNLPLEAPAEVASAIEELNRRSEASRGR